VSDLTILSLFEHIEYLAKYSDNNHVDTHLLKKIPLPKISTIFTWIGKFRRAVRSKVVSDM